MKKGEEQDDVDFEPEDELGSVGAVKAKLEKLKDELEKVKKERQEYLDGWQRAKADAVNTRRETIQEGQRAADRVRESFIHDLISPLDSFDLASGSPAWETIDKEWRSGMEQVRNQFLNVLQRHGVVRYGKAGDTFDHNLYEAVEETEDVPGESGTVFRILRYGYKMGDRVLRPAQVIVKK